eukprot:122015_1
MASLDNCGEMTEMSADLPYYVLKQLYDAAQIEIKILQKKADILQNQSSEQTLKFREMEHKLQFEFNQEASKYSHHIHELEQLLSYHTKQQKEHLMDIQKLRDENSIHGTSISIMETQIQRLTVEKDYLLAKNSKFKSDRAEMRELHIEIDKLREELRRCTQCGTNASAEQMKHDTDMPSPTHAKHIQYSFLRTPNGNATMVHPMLSNPSTPGTPSVGLMIYVRSSASSPASTASTRPNSLGSPNAVPVRAQNKQFSFRVNE